MMIKSVIGGAVGAAIGGVIGYWGKCRGGACPLTCNPWGGLIVGAMLGVLLTQSLFGAAAAETKTSEHVVALEKAEAFEEILKNNDVVLVDFYADWCGPCRRLKPTIHELADDYAGRIKVVAVNVDKFRELAQKNGISGIPDVRIFKGGKQVEKIVGLRGKSAFTQLLDKYAPAAGSQPAAE